MGRKAEAADLCKEVLRLQRATGGHDDAVAMTTAQNLGARYLELGRIQDAIAVQVRSHLDIGWAFVGVGVIQGCIC